MTLTFSENRTERFEPVDDADPGAEDATLESSLDFGVAGDGFFEEAALTFLIGLGGGSKKSA